MGINASNTAEVHFDNVRIPRDNLLGGKLFSLLDRPFCECDLMFCACFFFFICHLSFSDVRQPTLSKLFLHDVASVPKEVLLCRFPKSAPNKNQW